MNGIEAHRPLLIDTSSVLSTFVANDLLKWGSNLKFFSDIFTYNLLSTSKMLNLLVKEEGREFDLVSVHDWLSVMSGIWAKEAGRKVVFHVHSTEWGEVGERFTGCTTSGKYRSPVRQPDNYGELRHERGFNEAWMA